MKRIVFVTAASRQWAHLTADVRDRIRARLNDYAAGGRSDVKKLRGRGGARLRAGDWRVVFSEDKDVITVLAVGHRREIYE